MYETKCIYKSVALVLCGAEPTHRFYFTFCMLFIDSNDGIYTMHTHVYFTVDDSDWKTGSFVYIYRVKLGVFFFWYKM